jgi:hypothetical protein
MEFNELVGCDLRGVPLAEYDLQQLFGNPQKWRDRLVEKLQDIDKQLTSRRGESIKAGTRDARLAYEDWKKGAVAYKLAIVSRLTEIKRILKERNISEFGDRNEVFYSILEELREIRALLIQAREMR